MASSALLILGAVGLLGFSAPLVSSLNILGIAPLPSKSHHLWHTELMKGLARKGHQIYSVGIEPTEFGDSVVRENQTRSIVLEDMISCLNKDGNFDPISWRKLSPMQTTVELYSVCNILCDYATKTNGGKEALELVRNTKIDVIVMDITMGQCFYGLREEALGNPPLVGFTPFGSPGWVKDIVGGSNWPAFKGYENYQKAPPFNLWERTWNLIYYQVDDFCRKFYYLPREKEVAEAYIGRKLEKSLEDIEREMTTLLTNTHASFDAGTFLPPNVIEIGGLHVKDTKPLPQDIKKFIDEAEHGVVVLSLGTNVQSSTLGTEKLQAIVSALGQLKERVVWKFETDTLPNLPKNVMIKKWLPQSDILAHPKIRALWSHGGLLSTQEAVWRGIPVIAMPFFMDQYRNIDMLVSKGVGLRLDYDSLSTETVLKTLKQILTDPGITTRMKKLSAAYRDRPMSPIDTAIWYIEHAVRHPDGPLSSPGRNMSWVQFHLVDVYAVLGLVFLLVAWILKLLLKTVYNLVFRRGNKVEPKLKRK
ncbi:UDP-glycosyltransferase UGT5-like [Athalia rosae]|uniref:UDP-glycosyltransferase UGT5-like n=1 Tax=Athalia rosae TaxID=37344 RepID=UPI002033EEA9|nr:UDP-glycosyltransferase UGT5-like [Athalia rosae]